MGKIRWAVSSIALLLCMPTIGWGQGGLLLPPIQLQPIAQNLLQPVFITHASDGSNRIFIVEKQGIIKIYRNGVVQPAPFLDISGKILTAGEQGLLSLAFPGDYITGQHFYIYYTGLDGNNVVSRFQVSIDPDIADPGSEEILLTLSHPTYTNHNGGQLAFGPLDSYLYIGTGDGGGGGDPNGNGQNPMSLLGKILRIDVGSGAEFNNPYTIPPDNPYVGLAGYREEIWAMGLRNPWRFSFDRTTGDLYIGDVGQSQYEEIDFQAAVGGGGENYGWNILEGPVCYNPPAGCVAPAQYVAPIVYYDHTVGNSVTGGYVYRGVQHPVLKGVYFYADFGSGKIWGLRKTAADLTHALLLDTNFTISTFGEDEPGNLYVGGFSNGVLYRLALKPVFSPVYQLLLLN